MKRKIAIALMALMLTGCAKTERVEEAKKVSRFAIVEQTSIWKIVYDKETGVMYAVSWGSYNGGTFTLLVDAEGNPLTYYTQNYASNKRKGKICKTLQKHPHIIWVCEKCWRDLRSAWWRDTRGAGFRYHEYIEQLEEYKG